MKKANIWILFLAAFFLFCQNAKVQNSEKDKLINKRSKLEKEIELTNSLLKDTRIKKDVTIQEFKLINARIRNRNNIIAQVNDEIAVLEQQINKKATKLQTLKGELEKTKRSYAELIFYAFKNSNKNLDFMYLLAANSINQFYSRYKYLQQYKDYRLKNIQLINKLKKLIEIEIIELNVKKQERVNKVNLLLSEKASLSNDKEQLDLTISGLKQKEKELKAELEEKEKLKKQLDKEIEEIIKKEAKKKSYENLTPSEKIVSDDFLKNKGSLPWPTNQGIITDRYGEHDHPVIKNLKVRNNGIDISTVPGSNARAIFGGVITKVFTIKGANSTVIIRHGNFYSVYHNIQEVYVSPGTTVKIKDNIGKIYTDLEKSECILHFEIWKELEKQNPEEWISN